MKWTWTFLIPSLLFGILTACKTTTSYYRTPSQQAVSLLQEGAHSNERLIKQQQNTPLPGAIKTAMVENLKIGQNAKKIDQLNDIYNKHYNVNVSNVSAALFYKNLGKETPYSVIVDPNVKGTITINLKDVTIIQLFNVLRDTYGFNYRQTQFGFEIMPPRLETKSYHINYLDVLRKATSSTQISSADNTAATTEGSNGSSSSSSSASSTDSSSGSSTSQSQVNTTSSSNFWSDLSASLKALIGTADGRTVIVNPGSGTVIIKGFPEDIRQATSFIDQIQSNMSRQVVLEVKLLEIQLNDAFSAGIDWNIFGFNQTTHAFPTNTTPALPALTTITVKGNNFESVIHLLQDQGNVQTLANPRVLTINNQQAVIRIGNNQYYVTGVTTNVNNNGTTGSVTTATVNLTPFFSGVILDITPQISKNGQILLHLHPVISDVTAQKQSIDIGTGTPMLLPVADTNIREYDSIIRAQNEQVVLVGGLTQNSLNEDVQSTPLLGKVPFLGALFRATSQSSAKTELVILLKPTIIGRNDETMIDEMPVEETRISELDKGFHAGSLPEVFGNEAEKPKEKDTEIG